MEPKAMLDSGLCESSAVLETAFKLGLGGKQRISGNYILACGEEHKSALGATGRGTKKQAAQRHGCGVNNGKFNMAATQGRAVGCHSS